MTGAASASPLTTVWDGHSKNHLSAIECLMPADIHARRLADRDAWVLENVERIQGRVDSQRAGDRLALLTRRIGVKMFGLEDPVLTAYPATRDGVMRALGGMCHECSYTASTKALTIVDRQRLEPIPVLRLYGSNGWRRFYRDVIAYPRRYRALCSNCIHTLGQIREVNRPRMKAILALGEQCVSCNFDQPTGLVFVRAGTTEKIVVSRDFSRSYRAFYFAVLRERSERYDLLCLNCLEAEA